MVVALVQVRFPELMKLAKESMDRLEKAKDLQKLAVDLSMTQEEEQAKQILLSVKAGKRKRKSGRI